jgi:hypothetical protein
MIELDMDMMIETQMIAHKDRIQTQASNDFNNGESK